MRKSFLTLFIITGMLISTQGHAVPKETDRQILEQTRNLTVNPGFENGKAGWTESGSSTFNLETASPGIGRVSAKWDASATGEFLTGDLVEIPPVLQGKQCIAIMQYKSPSLVAGDVKLQAWDGSNILAEGDLNPADQWTQAFVIYTCPTSGSVAPRLASTANAAEVEVDAMHVGQSTKEITVASSELFGTLTYNTAANCRWQTTSASYASHAVDSDCNTTTATGKTTAPDTVIPGFKIPTMPPGKYRITANGVFLVDGASNNTTCHWALNSSTDGRFGNRLMGVDGATLGTVVNTITGILEVTTSRSNEQIEIQARRDSGADNCDIRVITSEETLQFDIIRFPLDSEKAILLSEANGWRIDANIGGANVQLGVGNVTTYQNMGNSALDLVTNSGSESVFISCNLTEVANAATCSVQNEAIGVAFTPPFQGEVEVCFSMTHNMAANAGAGIESIFQVIHRQNNDDTIFIALGNKRLESRMEGNFTTQDFAFPSTVCGIFDVSPSLQTFDLMFEQLISGSPNSSQILADRNAIVGQRDVHITARMVSQNFPMPVILDTVVSKGTGQQINTQAIDITFPAGVPTVSVATGAPWVSGIVDNGVGDVSLTVISGIFSQAPICTCSATGFNRQCTSEGTSTTNVNVRISATSSDTPVDQRTFVICVGI